MDPITSKILQCCTEFNTISDQWEFAKDTWVMRGAGIQTASSSDVPPLEYLLDWKASLVTASSRFKIWVESINFFGEPHSAPNLGANFKKLPAELTHALNGKNLDGKPGPASKEDVDKIIKEIMDRSLLCKGDVLLLTADPVATKLFAEWAKGNLLVLFGQPVPPPNNPK
ncbi:hypothetical protein CSAL01_01094 [Colletotrichum salicis]|uniref:Uncharacterized protein n=1 Tax=Colletotrichum salicis TaxID=1209931 RepID=A0A135V5M6_9PEZI|nr:hypothetical protein CSAL01_01094 [Colletotrichum salicis]